MNAKRFVRYSLLNLLGLLLLYLGLFYYQLGADLKSESSEIEISYLVKDAKAQRIGPARKIILLSGSNALFGIDSALLEQLTGLPVLNLAVHVSLDIDYLYFKMQQYIGAGDIVVMPLEYNHYSREGYSGWFVHNMMVWQADFFHSLPLPDKLRFIVNVDPLRLLQGISGRWRNGLYQSPQGILDNLRRLIDNEGVKWRGYSYTSMNLDGDISVDEPENVPVKQGYIPQPSTVSAHFLNTYQKISQLAARSQASLILTHPVTFRNDQYDLNQPGHRERADNLTRLLQNNGIHLQCDPALFHLDSQYAFDTFYHTNRQGAHIRTQNLARCIQAALAQPLEPGSQLH